MIRTITQRWTWGRARGRAWGRASGGLPRLLQSIALSCALAAGLASAAQAQMFGTPFGPDSKARMTSGDYKLWNQAVGKLLNEKPAVVGSTESWSNPQSGNHGVFTILKIYTMNNMPCRRVNSVVTYNPTLNYAPRSVTLGACQIPSGEWKATD